MHFRGSCSWMPGAVQYKIQAHSTSVQLSDRHEWPTWLHASIHWYLCKPAYAYSCKTLNAACIQPCKPFMSEAPVAAMWGNRPEQPQVVMCMSPKLNCMVAYYSDMD